MADRKPVHQLAIEMAEARGAMNTARIAMRIVSAEDKRFDADVVNEMTALAEDAERAFTRAHSAWEAASIDVALATQF